MATLSDKHNKRQQKHDTHCLMQIHNNNCTETVMLEVYNDLLKAKNTIVKNDGKSS